VKLAGLPGHRTVAASLAGTALFAVTAVPAAAGVDALKLAAAAVGLAEFVVAIPLALLALARAAVRTARQEDRITVGGLFFLQGSAPKPIKRTFLWMSLVCLAIAVGTLAWEPFGVLVPMLPVGLAGVWAARYGVFPPRQAGQPRRRG